jgi:hypothetical protein
MAERRLAAGGAGLSATLAMDQAMYALADRQGDHAFVGEGGVVGARDVPIAGVGVGDRGGLRVARDE